MPACLVAEVGAARLEVGIGALRRPHAKEHLRARRARSRSSAQPHARDREVIVAEDPDVEDVADVDGERRNRGIPRDRGALLWNDAGGERVVRAVSEKIVWIVEPAE